MLAMMADDGAPAGAVFKKRNFNQTPHDPHLAHPPSRPDALSARFIKPDTAFVHYTPTPLLFCCISEF